MTPRVLLGPSGLCAHGAPRDLHRGGAVLQQNQLLALLVVQHGLAGEVDPTHHVLVEHLQGLLREPREDVAGVGPRAREELVQGDIEEALEEVRLGGEVLQEPSEGLAADLADHAGGHGDLSPKATRKDMVNFLENKTGRKQKGQKVDSLWASETQETLSRLAPGPATSFHHNGSRLAPPSPAALTLGPSSSRGRHRAAPGPCFCPGPRPRG